LGIWRRRRGADRARMPLSVTAEAAALRVQVPRPRWPVDLRGGRGWRTAGGLTRVSVRPVSRPGETWGKAAGRLDGLASMRMPPGALTVWVLDRLLRRASVAATMRSLTEQDVRHLYTHTSCPTQH
jgi:hypothetical protein